MLITIQDYKFDKSRRKKEAGLRSKKLFLPEGIKISVKIVNSIRYFVLCFQNCNFPFVRCGKRGLVFDH